VRRLCAVCAAPQPPTPEQAAFLALPPGENFLAAVGCSQCAQTGYKGRFALYEYVAITAALRMQMADALYQPGKVAEILCPAETLRENGVKHVRMGHTSAAEVVQALLRA